MNKPVLVYAGHSYHRLTASTQFLLDLLGRHFQLSILWDDSWQPSGKTLRASQINELNPDTVLFFQTLPARAELERIKCRKLFHVPMHDQLDTRKRKWLKLRPTGIRMLNFCRATHAFFLELGYESRYVQYWPPPQARAAPSSDGLRIFFWARKQEIGWPLLKSLLGPARPERIIFRAAADPGQELDMPSDGEIREYNIEVVNGWLEKSRYIELLTSCNVFVAPRRCEGIGQSFLEAMSYGLAVIAPDAPTMNEYVQHGRNGYLYIFETPNSVDFANLRTLCVQAAADVRDGHHAWLSREGEILDYLASRPSIGKRFARWLRGLRRH